MINEYGNGPLDSSSVVVGRLKVSDHRGPITDASFSPDGTAIATASTDGQVKFFQVKLEQKRNKVFVEIFLFKKVDIVWK